MEQQKPIHFYVANLGSEVRRIFGWQEKGDVEAMNNAYKRSIEIIDRIKKFENTSANKEMDILKQYLSEFVFEPKESPVNKEQMSSYFNPFAFRVMNFS